MVELIAGLALAKYCHSKWKKAFPDVTKEELLASLNEKEHELESYHAAERIRNDSNLFLMVFAVIGWILFLVTLVHYSV